MAQNSFEECTNQDIEELIKCPICYDYCQDPRMLPCSHTFCLTCIRKLVVVNNGQFDCPLRDGTSISGNHVDSLPLNRTVRDLVEMFKKEEASTNCCNCGLHVARLWCRDCQAKAYCTECHLTVHKLPALADHRPGESEPPKIIKCDNHPTKEIEFWCSETERPCCSLCMLVPDVTRDCAPIEDVFNKIAERLKEDFRKNYFSINYDRKLQEMFKMYEESTTAKTFFIDEKFAALRKMVDEREKIIKEQKSSVDLRNRKAIETYQLALANIAKEFRQRYVLLDRIIMAKDLIRLLRNRKYFEEELDKLTAEFNELPIPVAEEFDIEGIDECLAGLEQSLAAIRIIEKPPYENEELEKLLAVKRDDGILNLNNLNFNDDHASIIARFLRNDKKTTILHLGNNHIKANGAKLLANSLLHNRTLKELELWNNQIGDEGAQYLASALRQNTTLTSLGLHTNQISDQGAQHLSALLNENAVLSAVYLNDNLITDVGLQYLVSALEHNKTLKQLHILQNPRISENIRKQMKKQSTIFY